MRIVSGLITGILCSLWQTALNALTVNFGLIPFLIQTFLFLLAGIIRGFIAERL
jgi:hypothetical protein